MTKENLQTGHIIERKDGVRGIVMLNCISTNPDWPDTIDIIVCHNGTNKQLADYNSDLSHPYNPDASIVKVYAPFNPVHVLSFSNPNANHKLLWKATKVEELTLEQVCKELGREIKIIK